MIISYFSINLSRWGHNLAISIPIYMNLGGKNDPSLQDLFEPARRSKGLEKAHSFRNDFLTTPEKITTWKMSGECSGICSG